MTLTSTAEVRVVEYHEYTIGGAVSDPKHCDSGSLVTMSVLLSDPRDYTGGCFTTLELDGSVTEFADIRRGDGLLFVSEKWHSVQPVLSGHVIQRRRWLPATLLPAACRGTDRPYEVCLRRATALKNKIVNFPFHQKKSGLLPLGRV